MGDSPLILPNQSLAEFNAHHDAMTPGKLDPKRNKREYAFEAPPEEKNHYQEERPAFSGWALPPNFCPDCGLNDITVQRGPDGQVRVNPGLWLLEESRPDLLLRIDDLIIYSMCHKCAHAALWQAEYLATASNQTTEEWEEKRAQKITRNLTQYVRAKVARGEKPVHIRATGERGDHDDR